MNPGTIIHPGIIESITDHTIRVRIMAQSACTSCHAKEACKMSDLEEKIVEVDARGTEGFRPGEHVMVRMDESLGRKAVVMGYVLPLAVLLVSIFTLHAVLNSEGLAALLSILILVPYYLVLYLFRDRLKKEFSFRIEHSGD